MGILNRWLTPHRLKSFRPFGPPGTGFLTSIWSDQNAVQCGFESRRRPRRGRPTMNRLAPGLRRSGTADGSFPSRTTRSANSPDTPVEESSSEQPSQFLGTARQVLGTALRGRASSQQGRASSQQGPASSQRGPASSQRGPASSRQGPASSRQGHSSSQRLQSKTRVERMRNSEGRMRNRRVWNRARGTLVGAFEALRLPVPAAVLQLKDPRLEGRLSQRRGSSGAEGYSRLLAMRPD